MGKKHNPKNSVAVLAERRQRIAALYCEGKSQLQIASIVGVSQPTVCLDLKAVQAQWLESSLLDFDHRRAQELAKLDHTEAEAWEAWHASKLNQEQAKARKDTRRVPVKGNGKRTTTKLLVVGEVEEKTSKGQTGDPRYLAIVAKCIEMRLRVMGALAPDQLTQVQQVTQVDWAGLYKTAEEVSQRVNPITATLKQLDAIKPVGPVKVIDSTPAHYDELNKPKALPAPKPKPKPKPVGDDF